MKAKELFDDAMSRAHALLELYKCGSKNDDILRMAVALGVAALDMYATERFLSDCRYKLTMRGVWRLNNIPHLLKAFFYELPRGRIAL